MKTSRIIGHAFFGRKGQPVRDRTDRFLTWIAFLTAIVAVGGILLGLNN